MGRQVVRSLWGGLIAGALGGALVGIGESTLVSLTSGAAEEYWLFLFGVVSYGIFGAVIGLGTAIGWQILRRGAASEHRVAQISVALAVGLPAFVVARYHVAQRIFGEQLVLASTAGLVAHVLLLAGALVAALIGIALVGACYRVAGSLATLSCVVLLAVIATGIGVVAGAGTEGLARRAGAVNADRRPNVILIVVDTLRADAAAKVMEKGPQHSGFARLAQDGVMFERAYSQASWTRPSIASILTSLYPSGHGTIHKMDILPDRVLTLAEAFRGEGYWTAAFTTNINVAPVFNFQQGFDEFRYLEPSFYFWASDSATKLAAYKILRVLRERFFSDRMYVEHYYQDADTVDRNVEHWISSKPPEPFFLFVHYMDPHDPYFDHPYNGHGVARVMTPSPPPERAQELHDLYLQGARYLDDYLLKLVQKLADTGLYDRSVIAVTADHGEEFYEHGGWWHGTDLYEQQIHVPLIIKHPKEGMAGKRRDDYVRSIDIAPTLMKAAGAEPPSSFVGIDLFSGRVDEPLYSEEDLEGNRLNAIRTSDGEWKLITANAGNPRGLAPVELYNLKEDPTEQKNLAGIHKDKVSDLLAQMENLRSRIAEHGRRAMEAAKADATDPRT
jgi:arylsulfatase A-like enzyme